MENFLRDFCIVFMTLGIIVVLFYLFVLQDDGKRKIQTNLRNKKPKNLSKKR